MRILIAAPIPPARDAPGAIGRVLHAQLVGLAERHEVTIAAIAGPEDVRPAGRRQACSERRGRPRGAAARARGCRALAPSRPPRQPLAARWRAVADRVVLGAAAPADPRRAPRLSPVRYRCRRGQRDRGCLPLRRGARDGADRARGAPTAAVPLVGRLLERAGPRPPRRAGLAPLAGLSAGDLAPLRPHPGVHAARRRRDRGNRARAGRPCPRQPLRRRVARAARPGARLLARARLRRQLLARPERRRRALAREARSCRSCASTSPASASRSSGPGRRARCARSRPPTFASPDSSRTRPHTWRALPS